MSKLRSFCLPCVAVVGIFVLASLWEPQTGLASQRVIFRLNDRATADLVSNRSIDVRTLPPRLKEALLQTGAQTLNPIGRQWRDSTRLEEGMFCFAGYYFAEVPHIAAPRLESLRSLAEVSDVFLDPQGRSPDYLPSDTLLYCHDGDCGRNYQWNFKNTGGSATGSSEIECEEGVDIGLEAAYALQDTVSVRIALLDSGVESEHPDLDDVLDDVLGRAFVGDPADSLDWEDVTGHGTRVAGILAAEHSADSSVVGIAGKQDGTFKPIVPIRITRDGSSTVYVSDVINALAYCAEKSVPIAAVEVTFGSANADSIYTLKGAIYNAYADGVFLAMAGGNNNSVPAWPGQLQDHGTTVTSIGCDGSRDSNLKTGSHIDVAAPGQASGGVKQIVTTTSNGSYGVHPDSLFGGTSAALPHAAGAAALMLSFEPTLTNEDISEILHLTAWDIGASDTGNGLVRADSALIILDTYDFSTASTTSLSNSTRLQSKKLVKFANIEVQAANINTPSFASGLVQTRSDLYRIEGEVSLSANTNMNFSPPTWIRGRASLASDQDGSSITFFDHPYDAFVDSVTSTTAYVSGYTYQLFDPADTTVTWGWWPLKLPPTGSSDLFSVSYLADGSMVPRPEITGPSGTAARPFDLPQTLVLSRQRPEAIRLQAPESGSLTFELFDISGRRVWDQLLEVEQGPGQIHWNPGVGVGKLPAGIYFGRVQQGLVEARLRVVLVR